MRGHGRSQDGHDRQARQPHDDESNIFGSPTYFGSLLAVMKGFLESTVDRWIDVPRWKDKLAAGFTNSKTMSGDRLNTLFDLAAFAAQHGMIWVWLDLYPGWHTADPAGSNVRTLPAAARE